MGTSKRKSGIARTGNFLLGYALGALAWILGLHCLRLDPNARPVVQRSRFLMHFLKLSLWTIEIGLVYRVLVLLGDWLYQTRDLEAGIALLGLTVIFLYIKIFWPWVFPKILPGFNVFFCPQCFQKQIFRFLPVSLQYGFFVTYLCRYCSCLVNGFGEQVFYPLRVPFKRIVLCSTRMLPAILTAMVLGFYLFRIIDSHFL